MSFNQELKARNLDLIHRVLCITNYPDSDLRVSYIPTKRGLIKISLNCISLFSNDGSSDFNEELTWETVEPFEQAIKDVTARYDELVPKTPFNASHEGILSDAIALYACRRKKLRPLLDEGEEPVHPCMEPVIEALPYPRAENSTR